MPTTTPNIQNDLINNVFRPDANFKFKETEEYSSSQLYFVVAKMFHCAAI